MINKYRKESYWDIFQPHNQFYIGTTKEALFSFTSDELSSSYGIQLFYTKQGFNYLHDRFVENPTCDDCVSDCEHSSIFLTNEEYDKIRNEKIEIRVREDGSLGNKVNAIIKGE